MNQNCIHDALNLLDDSLIEAVDILRNRPLKRKIQLTHFVSAAAILCIALAGALALMPQFRAENDSASIQYGAVEENHFLADQIVTESAGDYSIAYSPACIRVLELTDNGFLAEVVANYECLDVSAGSVLTVVYTDDIPAETILKLKVGDVVDVIYGRDSKVDTMIFAYSIQQASDE